MGCGEVVVEVRFIKLQYRKSRTKSFGYLPMYPDTVLGWIVREGALAVLTQVHCLAVAQGRLGEKPG